VIHSHLFFEQQNKFIKGITKHKKYYPQAKLQRPKQPYPQASSQHTQTRLPNPFVQQICAFCILTQMPFPRGTLYIIHSHLHFICIYSSPYFNSFLILTPPHNSLNQNKNKKEIYLESLKSQVRWTT
jgi:hypothetical protein